MELKVEEIFNIGFFYSYSDYYKMEHVIYFNTAYGI